MRSSVCFRAVVQGVHIQRGIQLQFFLQPLLYFFQSMECLRGMRRTGKTYFDECQFFLRPVIMQVDLCGLFKNGIFRQDLTDLPLGFRSGAFPDKQNQIFPKGGNAGPKDGECHQNSQNTVERKAGERDQQDTGQRHSSYKGI